MATSNSFPTAPANTAPSPSDKPGLLERFALGAKHMIVLGCLGLIVTLALFVWGGYAVWNYFTAAASETVAAQHNLYHAGQERDVCIGAPVGWRVMVHDDNGGSHWRNCN